MRKILIVAAVAALSAGLAGPSRAQVIQDTVNGTQNGFDRGNAAAGPLGGIVGGAVGAGVGAATGALGTATGVVGSIFGVPGTTGRASVSMPPSRAVRPSSTTPTCGSAACCRAAA